MPSIPSTEDLMIGAESIRDIVENLPKCGGNYTELNNFVKRVRSGELSVEEVISALHAFPKLIAWPQKLSPALGGLLALLFAHLESSWSGETFDADVRAVQLVLVKKIFAGGGVRVAADNLAMWAGALKEIRMLSGAGRDWALEWVLERCEGSNPSDWPVLFHNLLSNAVDHRIFSTLAKCLLSDPRDNRYAARDLMNHFIFLAGQNGKLGKAWMKWVIGSQGPFGTTPLMFSGLLILSQDMEYYETLNTTLLNFIKCIHEVWSEVKKVKNPRMISSLVDPFEYLDAVARCIPEDSESGIRAALLLISNLSSESELGAAFYLSLFRAHPFARRELLKNFSSRDPVTWRKLYEIDELIVREGIKMDVKKMKEIVKFVPEMLGGLIEGEEVLERLFVDEAWDFSVRLTALIEIDSVMLDKTLKSSEVIVNVKNQHRMEPIIFSASREWKSVSLTEIGLMRSGLISVPDGKMVELCDLVLLPGVIEDRRDALIGLAVDFLSGYAEISKKERLGLISRLISSEMTISNTTITKIGSFERVYALLDEEFETDLGACSGTLKFLIQRTAESSDPFYRIIPKIPGSSLELLILAARAIGDFDGSEGLRDEIGGLIGLMASKVVAEPNLSKPLQGLLQKHWKSKASESRVVCGLSKFVEISEVNLLKSVIDFGLKYGDDDDEVIPGMRMELIKSILMFYGVIEDESGGGGVGGGEWKGMASRFKHLHLNEKSVAYALNALLNAIQTDLLRAHKLLKLCPQLFTENPDDFVDEWVIKVAEKMLLGLTKALIGGKIVGKLHSILASFYNLCTKLVKLANDAENGEMNSMKKLTRLVGEQLNRHIYALIPLQQEKMQSDLKHSLNLKKSGGGDGSSAPSTGRSVTMLIFAMEKYEEAFLRLIRRRNGGWSERIVRSTARDFKIKLEEL